MFKLPTELTIVQVDECKSQFLDFSQQHDEITIDDSEVNRIDTIGVQFLLTLVTYVAAQNKTLHWESQSSIISQSVKQLGINEDILNQYLNA